MESSPQRKRQKMDKEEDQSNPKVQANDIGLGCFDLLPNELVEHIFKMTMGNMTTQKRYEFLVNIIPNVSSRFRSLSSTKSLWRGFAPLEMLPNEVALIPIKMAMANSGRYGFDNHTHLLDTIAKVSTRMKTLATSKALWKGRVSVQLQNEETANLLLKECLNEATSNLYIDTFGNEGAMSVEKIPAISSKCPNLKELNSWQYSLVETWPTFPVPWTSLEKLTLYVSRRDMFEGVQLHNSLPNLKHITIISRSINRPVDLPDMRKCEYLEEVRLLVGPRFKVNGLPRGLKRLRGDEDIVICNLDRNLLKSELEMCEIDAAIKFEN